MTAHRQPPERRAARSEQRSPMARAFVDTAGCVTVPCSGVVQAANVLPIVQAAPEMLDLLRRLHCAAEFLAESAKLGVADPVINEARALLAKIDGSAP